MFRAGDEAKLTLWLQREGHTTLLKRMYFINVSHIHSMYSVALINVKQLHMIRILVIVDVRSYNLRWMRFGAYVPIGFDSWASLAYLFGLCKIMRLFIKMIPVCYVYYRS